MAKRGSARAIAKVKKRAARQFKKSITDLDPDAWARSLIPDEIAAALTDPCGVTYYTNRVNEAREYRPFYRSKLNDLQDRVILARGKAVDIRESMEAAYDEMRAEIGVNKEEGDRVVQAIKTGDTTDSDLRKAHWFIYGTGEATWGSWSYLLGYISSDLRSDLKRLLNTYIATSTDLNGVLREIDTIHAVATESLNCSQTVVDQLTSWEGNALNTAMGFCQETNGMDYLTNRMQVFSPRGKRATPLSGELGENQGWSAWNDPCDTFRKTVDGGYSYQQWPWTGASNWERPLPPSLGYPHWRWGKGFRKDWFGNYPAAKVSGPEIRSCLDYLTSTLPNATDLLLNDHAGHVNALFGSSERLMRQAKDIINQILTLLRGLRDALGSPGMNFAIDAAEILCFCSVISAGRDSAVRGLQGAIRDLKGVRDQLTAGISGHATAKTMWVDPSTEWRITAEMAVNGLRSLNTVIQTPWTNSVAQTTCSTIFPEIPKSCLEKMVPEVCHTRHIYVAHEETGWIDPGDAEGRSPGSLGEGRDIPAALVELGALAPASSEPKRFMGLLPWQGLALIAGVWMFWPEKKR